MLQLLWQLLLRVWCTFFAAKLKLEQVLWERTGERRVLRFERSRRWINILAHQWSIVASQASRIDSWEGPEKFPEESKKLPKPTIASAALLTRRHRGQHNSCPCKRRDTRK